MDPQATWENLLDAYEATDWDNALEAAQSLRLWIDRGGFPPKTCVDRAMDVGWHRAIALAACRFVAGEAQIHGCNG